VFVGLAILAVLTVGFLLMMPNRAEELSFDAA
jgi:hypothetical protein